jgi:hypothetical protein
MAESVSVSFTYEEEQASLRGHTSCGAKYTTEAAGYAEEKGKGHEAVRRFAV